MKKISLIAIFLFIGVSVQGTVLNVYFGTGGTDTKGIYQAKFDLEKGTLSDVRLAAEIGRPGFLTLHPDKQKLYAVGRLEGESVVAGYQISPSGDLKQFTVSAIGDGGGAHLAIHPSGKFLLTAQYGGGSTALFPLDEDGKLGTSVVTEHSIGSNVNPEPQDKPHPHWCGFSPDGQYAFVPDLGMNEIVIYRVDQNKPKIINHGSAASVPGGGPRHMRFSIDGKFIYLLNELTLSVTTFKYDASSGVATQLSTTLALSEDVLNKEKTNEAAEILVHPNGRFVYSSNRGNDSITSYLVDPESGLLAVNEVEPIRGAWPRNINMDRSGRWLLAAGAHSNTISVFTIDQTSGELTYMPNSIINVPGPICILFLE